MSFRICYINPDKNQKFQKFQNLTFIKDKFLKEHEEEIDKLLSNFKKICY